MSLQGNNLAVYSTSVQNDVVSLTGAAGALGTDTNGVVVYTAGANGSRVYNLFLSTNSNSAVSIFLYINNSSIYCPIGQISIPASSGNIANKPCVDALAAANCLGLPFDGNQKPYIELAPNASLKISLTATSMFTIYASAIGADY